MRFCYFTTKQDIKGLKYHDSSRMQALNNFINKYFGVILLSSAIIGLYFPLPAINTSLLIIIALAIVIFSSYFKINLNNSLLRTDWKAIIFYFIVRFVLLPIVAFHLFRPFTNFYSISFFMLLLLPSAVSSPAFSAMYNGSVSLALKILIFSSFISIATIPLLSGTFLSKSVKIDSLHMFLILVYTIVIPFAVHIPFRKSHQTIAFFRNNNPVITALGLMSIFVFSTAKNRDIILNEPLKVLVYTGISSVFFLLLYFLGYYLIPKAEKRKKIAFSVCSGANNVGMGVTLTMLFFPGEINVFFIVAQIAWIFVLIPMRYFYRMESNGRN